MLAELRSNLHVVTAGGEVVGGGKVGLGDGTSCEVAPCLDEGALATTSEVRAAEVFSDEGSLMEAGAKLGKKRSDMVTADGSWAKATFHVADVARSLFSVSRMCDMNDRAMLELGGGYVESWMTAQRM